MFGKALDMGAKRDFMGAFVFFVASLTVLVGFSTVLVHFLGITGFVEGSGGFFEGGEMHTMIGTFFVMWLGGMTLHKRNMTDNLMAVIMVGAGLYFAWTATVMIGLIPIALLTTMGDK